MTVTHSRIDWDAVRGRLERYQSQDGSGSVKREQLADVFHERAERLAQRGRDRASSARQKPYVVFGLGNQRFGVELACVKQIFPRLPITPVPGLDRLILGVANLNGTLRSIIDLRVLVNLPMPETDAGYIILLRASGQLLGVWVESLDGIFQVNLDRLTAVDDVASDSIGKLAMGVTDDRILTLDVKLLIEHVAERTRQRANN